MIATGTRFEPAADGLSPLSSEPLVGALQSLYRAFQKTSIYPQGHPAVPEALAKAVHEFAPAFAVRDTLLLAIGRDSVTFEDEPLREASGAVSSLASLLHDLDVAALEFSRGLTADELHDFVRVLGVARRSGSRGPELVELLEERELRNLSAIPIDYNALQFADGPRADAEDPNHDVWTSLTTVLTDPSVLAGSVSPAELARQVSAEIRRKEGTGVALLRKRIRRMADSIRQVDSRQRSVLRKRMQEFLSALNPDLRGDLLRIDVAAASESLSLISELADVVPEPDLLDALQEIDRVGGRVPTQMLTLMNKLVRISAERPSLASGFEDTLGKWGIPLEFIKDDSPNMRKALEEIFQSRARLECNPEPYQDLLDDLARAELPDSKVTLASRYRDPRNERDVRVHAAEVAVQVLGRGSGERYRAGLFGYVESASGLLIEDRRFDALRDAAVHARTYSLLSKQSEEVRRAASCYMGEFTKEARIKHILKHACAGETLPEAAISLLGLGGEQAMDRALDFLSYKQPVEVTRALTRFVAQAGAERVRDLIAGRESGGWGRLRPLFRILREMGSSESVPLLEGLCRHNDSRVRREAYLLACEIDRRPSALEHHLRRALADEDQNLVAIAVFRLSQHKTRTSLGMLGAYLRGALAGVHPSFGMGSRVVKALLASGEIGVKEVIASLDALRWSLMPNKITMGTVVVGVLELQRQIPGIDECLARWNGSLACLISRLFPQLRRRGLTAGTR